MRLETLFPAAAALALSACGTPAEEANQATAAGSAVMNGAPAGAQPGPDAPEPVTAEQYVALAAAGDLYEMESARIALARSDSAELRGLAQMILSDHERASAALRSAAGEADPPLAPGPVLSPEQQANVERLRTAPADAFDREWLRQQVDAHQKALRLVTVHARRGEVPSLRRHAAAQIAPVQTHLIRARALAGRQTLE